MTAIAQDFPVERSCAGRISMKLTLLRTALTSFSGGLLDSSILSVRHLVAFESFSLLNPIVLRDAKEVPALICVSHPHENGVPRDVLVNGECIPRSRLTPNSRAQNAISGSSADTSKLTFSFVPKLILFEDGTQVRAVKLRENCRYAALPIGMHAVPSAAILRGPPPGGPWDGLRDSSHEGNIVRFQVLGGPLQELRDAVDLIVMARIGEGEHLVEERSEPMRLQGNAEVARLDLRRLRLEAFELGADGLDPDRVRHPIGLIRKEVLD
jgi:hypothetical protein